MIGGLQKTLRDLSGGMLSLDKLAELGLVEKAEDGSFKAKLAVTAPKPAEKKAEDDPITLRVKALEGQLAEEKKAKEQLVKDAETRDLNSAVIAALSKAGAHNPDRDFVHLTAKVLKGANGYVVAGKDKYGADIELTLDEHADGFLKANPELRKSQQLAGSGTPPGGAPAGQMKGTGKVIPKATWSDMNWFAQNSAKFQSGEYLRGAE